MTDKFIRILDGKIILKTDDNFKTFQKVESIDGYEVLQKRNLMSELSLRYTYGDKKASIIINELKKINDIIFGKSAIVDNGYGRAFEVFALSVIYDITYSQAMKYVINGPNDGKVDAIFWTDETVYLYQIKMNTILEQETLEIAKKNYKQFLNDKDIKSQNTSDLLSFLKTNETNIANKKLQVWSITTSPTKGHNICSKELFEKYFKRLLLPQTASNICLVIDLEEVEDEETGLTHRNYIQTESNTFIFAHAENMLDSLYSQGVSLKKSDKLFYDNVRGFTGVNQAMQETIKNKPKIFELYNNGLSILGNVKITTTKIIINNPTIINGQQTLFNLMYAKEKGLDLSEIILPVFIKTLPDKAEQLNVAKFNNTQKQVKDIDLLSISADIRQIQENLLTLAISNNFLEDSYYLQIISNGKRMFDRDIKTLFPKNAVISLTDFIRIYWVVDRKKLLGSWKNNVNKMISSEIVEKNYHFFSQKAIKICKIITKYYDYLETLNDTDKRNCKVADVVFMFLMNKYNDVRQVQQIINYINTKVFMREHPSKLIDLYKSNNIMKYIDEAELQIKDGDV